MIDGHEKRIENLEQAVRQILNVRDVETIQDNRVGAAVRLLIGRGATKFKIRENSDGSWDCLASDEDGMNTVNYPNADSLQDGLESVARLWTEWNYGDKGP